MLVSDVLILSAPCSTLSDIISKQKDKGIPSRRSRRQSPGYELQYAWAYTEKYRVTTLSINVMVSALPSIDNSQVACAVHNQVTVHDT